MMQKLEFVSADAEKSQDITHAKKYNALNFQYVPTLCVSMV